MTKSGRRSERTHKLVLSALFAALITVGAFIRINVPAVPFTMQMCFVNLAGLMLGGLYGGLSALIYLVLGLIGLPIFAKGYGGFQYVFEPSFGYIVGFVFAAFFCGLISHAGKKKELTIGKMVLGTLATFVCVYICGLTHAYLISVFHTHSPLSMQTLFVGYMLMFWPGDILTCALSIVVAKKMLPILERQGFRLYKTKEEKELQREYATKADELHISQELAVECAGNVANSDVTKDITIEDKSTVVNDNNETSIDNGKEENMK